VTTARKVLCQVILLAAAYFLLGKLSLVLAIPPGYVSPIFPPAGIALVALLLWGFRVWPGIFVGALFLGFSISWPHEIGWIPCLRILLISSALATGSTLAPLSGAWLIRRFNGPDLTLAKASDILQFLFLGGPVASLVGAVLDVSMLVYAKVISPEGFIFSLWNWWIGDTIGVIVAAPVLLSFVGLPKELWKKRRISVALPLSLTFGVYVIILFQSSTWEEKSVQADFESTATDLALRVQRNFDGYFDCLYALEGALIVNRPISGSAFGFAAKRWFSLYPGTHDFSWSPRIFDKDRANFEKQMRDSGYVNYQIVDVALDGNLVRAPRRAEYFPSQFTEPYRPDKTLMGYDTNIQPERHRAVERARDSGKPTTVGPIMLAQRDQSQTTAVMVVYPVYSGPHATLESRRKNLMGILKSSFSLHDVILASTGKPEDRRFSLSIFEDPESTPLYSELPTNSSSELGAEFPSPSTIPLTLADRYLTIKVVPVGSFWRRQIEMGSWTLLGAGLILTSLLSAFLLSLTGSNFIIKNELDEKQRVSEQLHRSMAELSRSNADLESFAYLASHDLKEPLRTISSHLQVVERNLAGKMSEDAHASLFFAVDAAKRMSSLIQDLLEYSRVGRSSTKRTTVEVGWLISAAIADLKTAITDSGAQIVVGNMPSLNLVQNEGVLLFENLLGNAIKYRDKSRPPIISISAERSAEDWVLSVKDNGIGIPKDSVHRIFGLFQRLHGRKDYPGTGIGLAICKRIVESHRGRIWVESNPGDGSIFHVSLPA
jgi:signal transduction histidine kinase/integral membrane sensor domain MASE1